MSTKIKGKGKTFPAKVGSSAKSKTASLPTPLDGGGAGNAVKGQDERQHRAPLTAFPARCSRLSFFGLTPAVVVIDRMTEVRKFFLPTKAEPRREFASSFSLLQLFFCLTIGRTNGRVNYPVAARKSLQADDL
jgi:hypothetical protein